MLDNGIGLLFAIYVDGRKSRGYKILNDILNNERVFKRVKFLNCSITHGGLLGKHE